MSAPRSSAQVLEFGSGEGKMTLGNVPALSFRGQDPWAIELWVYFDAIIDEMDLVSRAGEFSLQTRGATVYAARSTQYLALQSPPILEHHRWYHLAVTFDGMTMTLYVNGLRVSFVTLSDPGVANQGKPLTVGAGLYGWSDSVRLWNVARPQNVIYANQWIDAPAGTPNLIGQIDLSLWPPKDTSGSNLPVTLSATGISRLQLTPAVNLGGDAFCDPYNDEAVNPGGGPADFSVMAWVSTAQLGTAQTIFSNGTAGADGMVLGVAPGGQVTLQLGGGAPLQSVGVVSSGDWHNVCCTWTAANGAAALYLDGLPDRTGTLPVGTARTKGAPLLGAVAVPTQPLPDRHFLGAIQSVSVWNRVLSAADVTTYQTADPVQDPQCVADWDLMAPKPQNSSSLNPIGIVGDASVQELVGHVTATAVDDDERARADDEERAAARPPVVEGIFPPRVTADDLSDDQRAAWVSEFRAFMETELGVPEDQRDELAAMMEERLSAVAAQLADGTARVPAHEIATEALGGGRVRVTLHLDGESVVIHEGELDACTVWAIWFVIYMAMAIWTAFGWTLKLDRVAAGLTTYLGTRINTVGLLPQLRALFPGNQLPSPTTMYQALKLLWEYGLLTGVAKFLWQAVTLSLDFWTVITLGTRIALLFSPWAPAEIALFIVQLTQGILTVINQWNSPDNCWKSGEAVSGAPSLPATTAMPR